MPRSKSVVTTSFIVLAAATASNAAIIGLTSGSPTHNQNFDGLGTTSGTFVQDSTLPGWYAVRSGTGTSITASTGTGTAGDLYNYGSAGDPDRALGSVGSGNAAAGDFAWGAQFRNDDTANITSIDIRHTGEQWRSGGTNSDAQTVAFFYRVGGTGFTTDNTGWTPVTALDFTSPINNSAAGALDGNAAANRVVISNSFAVNVAPTETLWIKFSDPNHAGTDHGLSSDDFGLTATFAAIPEPTTFAVLASLGLVVLRRRRTI